MPTPVYFSASVEDQSLQALPPRNESLCYSSDFHLNRQIEEYEGTSVNLFSTSTICLFCCLLDWLCQGFEAQKKNAEKHSPLGQLQKHYNIPQLSHCHHNCTPGGAIFKEGQARTHPGTHCTRHHSGLAEREATLKVRAHVASWRIAIMQMPFPSISPTPLPYHMAFLCTVTQGTFLVTTNCPNLRQDLYRRYHPQFMYTATLRAYYTKQSL